MVIFNSYVKLPEGTIQFIAPQMMFASGHLTSAVAARAAQRPSVFLADVGSIASMADGWMIHFRRYLYCLKIFRNRSWTRHKAAWRSTAMLLMIMIHYSSDFYAPGLATRAATRGAPGSCRRSGRSGRSWDLALGELRRGWNRRIVTIVHVQMRGASFALTHPESRWFRMI